MDHSHRAKNKKTKRRNWENKDLSGLQMDHQIDVQNVSSLLQLREGGYVNN